MGFRCFIVFGDRHGIHRRTSAKMLLFPWAVAASAHLLPMTPSHLMAPSPVIMYNALLANHPMATRISTAASLALAGDALAQIREHGKRYDWRRAVSFMSVEATYRGLLQQRILMSIIATFSGGIISNMLPFHIPITTAATIERVLINQVLVAPCLYYPLYFSVTGPMQGLSPREALQRAGAMFTAVFGINSCFWFPVQLAQFAIVPQAYKVPFICLAGLAWNVVLSTLAGSACKCRRNSTKDGGRPDRLCNSNIEKDAAMATTEQPTDAKHFDGIAPTHILCERLEMDENWLEVGGNGMR